MRESIGGRLDSSRNILALLIFAKDAIFPLWVSALEVNRDPDYSRDKRPRLHDCGWQHSRRV
jgi:hypothetical protein